MNQTNGTLQSSSPDTIALAAAVEERFLELCPLYFKQTAMQLVPPKSLDVDMLRWRTMRMRHKHGDFRNTESELKSTRVIAQWTVDEVCKLRGQPSKKILWAL
ncbi:hypothetical protein M0R72_14240 [Candidatus Pacearchaeota archaeon]|jgi:hypothetical protein|nr:hypothetical protein [Candidatus Pacearchaeota archaeon]